MKRRAFKKKVLCKIIGENSQIRTASINEQLELIEMLVYHKLTSYSRKNDTGAVSSALTMAYNGVPDINIAPFLTKSFVGIVIYIYSTYICYIHSKDTILY
jgi:hypothetical protein